MAIFDWGLGIGDWGLGIKQFRLGLHSSVLIGSPVLKDWCNYPDLQISAEGCFFLTRALACICHGRWALVYLL
jgi:hypothetical protein